MPPRTKKAQSQLQPWTPVQDAILAKAITHLVLSNRLALYATEGLENFREAGSRRISAQITKRLKQAFEPSLVEEQHKIVGAARRRGPRAATTTTEKGTKRKAADAGEAPPRKRKAPVAVDTETPKREAVAATPPKKRDLFTLAPSDDEEERDDGAVEHTLWGEYLGLQPDQHRGEPSYQELSDRFHHPADEESASDDETVEVVQAYEVEEPED